MVESCRKSKGGQFCGYVKPAMDTSLERPLPVKSCWRSSPNSRLLFWSCRLQLRHSRRSSSSCSGGLRLWKESPSPAAPGECLGSSLYRVQGPTASPASACVEHGHGGHSTSPGSGALIYVARTCPLCQRCCVPSAQLEGVVLGKQRLGVNLVSLIAALREEARLPWRTIQWYLGTVHGLHLPGGPGGRCRQSGSEPRANWRALWNASGAVRWSTPMRRAGGRTDTTATCGPSVRPPSELPAAGKGRGG